MAAGRILREAIVADRPLPPYDRCMMDGYAIRAAEARPGSIFTIRGRVHAGEPVSGQAALEKAIQSLTT